MRTSAAGNAAVDGGAALGPQWEAAILSFMEFERAHRGLRDSTIEDRASVLRKFASAATDDGAVAPDAVTVEHLDRFLVRYASRSRDQARLLTNALRAFIAYLAISGQAELRLVNAVPRTRAYALARLPHALAPNEVQRVVQSADRRIHHGREYAIVVLLATYGLRAGDVAALTLDDLHWRQGTLRVRVGKTGRDLVLPLTDLVGDAILSYVKSGRPRNEHREVFLSTRGKPVTAGWITKVAGSAITAAGATRHKGTAAHAFRHALATRMLNRGVALKTISDCLGHASTASTFVYLKLAVEDLRGVALDPREVLP